MSFGVTVHLLALFFERLVGLSLYFSHVYDDVLVGFCGAVFSLEKADSG